MIHLICYPLMAGFIAFLFMLFTRERQERLSCERHLEMKEAQLSDCWKEIAELKKPGINPGEICKGCKNLICITSYSHISGFYPTYLCRKDLNCKDYEEGGKAENG